MQADLETGNGATYLGGLEKAYVRENCWYPLLQERKILVGGRLQYLTLPGKQLNELRDLVEKKVIEGPQDLVLIERDLMDYYAIVRDVPLLPYKYRVEPFVIINGDANDLIMKGKLDGHLPIDAINLDYCGFFWGTDNLASDKWKSIKRLIEVQAQHRVGEQPRPFTLLLTAQGRGAAHESLSDALLEYQADVGEHWSAIEQYPYHGKLLYALPLMIIHAGFGKGYDVRCRYRYIYRPISVGGSAMMLSFGFTFEPLPHASDTISGIKQHAHLEQQHCTEILTSKPKHIEFDKSSQQLKPEEDYDPMVG